MPGNITINGVTFTPEDIGQIADAVVAIIQTTAKDPSQYEVVDTVEGVTSLPVFKQSGNAFTLVRVLTSLLKGADGKQIELQANETHLQWRLLGAISWIDLLPISVLQEPAKDAIELYGADIAELKAVKFDAVDKDDEGLWFFADGELVAGPIEVGSGTGSGGTGGGSTLRVVNLGSSSLGVAVGETVILKYSFSSVDAETGDPTGDGTAVYFVNNVRASTQNIAQGEVSFDITKFLVDGVNQVRIQVTDSYNSVRSLNIRIQVVSLSIRSTFDDSLIYNNDIDFPFTPVGTGEKVIHFVLNGVELDTVTTTASNRQLTYRLPALGHGAQSLKVYAKMDVDGVELTSNVLNFSIIYVVSGNQNVIISSSFIQTEATQFDTIVIPYSVYNPQSSTSPVQLKVNGNIVSDLTVDRTQQKWSYRIEHYGNLTLEIISGSVSKTFNLTVEKSNIDSEAETTGLELFLTSNGRSNNETNREEWKYNSIAATLTGFNYITNGWVLDGDGVTVLRVSAGAAVVIPFKPFQNDFKNTGKTLEFEFSVHDVEDFTVPVISCWSGNRGFEITANEIRFASELSSLSARFKEDEVIRLSLVVENRYDKRLIFTYINGIASGAQQYALTDDFSQANPVGISIGHEKCTVDIYNIRSYAAELNSFQILNNYIADTALVSKKLDLYDRNQIYDSSGEIVYNRLLSFLPCMTIIGDLPTFKGDKKTVRVVYENAQNPEKAFTSENVQIDVQGTSSQFYPRKNFKTKHRSGFDMTESGEHQDKYVLMGNDLPASVFCEKADFAESSGTHNTGMAKFLNDLLKNFGVKTPPQSENNSIRTTVDGYPIAIFHKADESSQPVFVGKYNFNHDKDAQEVFGLTGTAECWEFANNTSNLCLFKNADFSGDWNDDLEARYPDGYEDNSNIKKVWEWVVSCIGNPTKFKAEFEQHFNKNNILSYWILTELFGMVDQRAKNMFITSWGNEGSGEYKWYFIFYDNDTTLGINNEGAISFGYDIETYDTIGSGHVWNGWDSELWKLVEACYADELAQVYRDMRTSGLLAYNRVAQVLNEEQCAKWCEVVYNMDGQYKYIQPIVDEGNASYLYALQGSRMEHRKWWLSNRFFYMDSKYHTGEFLNDFVSMRLYTPTSWTGVAPYADFMLTLFKDAYVRVKYGSYLLGQRAASGDVVHIVAPAIQFNDTETVVYGVSAIQSLGDLSAKYPGTVDISSAKKLVELIIGSAVEGYRNENLTHISIGNNTLLKKVDIQNCPNLTEPLDVSGCDNLQEIYANGSSISMVVLPPAGVLETLRLPDTIANLTVKNQPALTDATFSISGTDNITTLVLENMNNIDQMSLIKELLGKNPRKLNRVRLIGIDVTDYDLSAFITLKSLQGLDESGIAVDRAVITGKVSVTTTFQSEFDEVSEAFPELVITAGIIQPDPVTTFVFTSSSGETLSNSSFECNRPFTKVNDFTYEVAAPVGFDIVFTYRAENHTTLQQTYKVTTTRTQNYTILYTSLKTVTFKDNSGVVLVGVVAKINDDTYTSDATGSIYIRTNSAFSGTAVKENYGNISFNIPASLMATTTNITIYPYVNVTFLSKEGLMNTLLPDVFVYVNGQTIKTDALGRATIQLSRGYYDVSYMYDNKSFTLGIIGVYDVDMSQVLTVDAQYFNLADLQPAEDESIQIVFSGTNSNFNYLYIVSDDANYTIDWGDGTIESAKGLYGQTYGHNYGRNEIAYLVKIRNVQNVTNLYSPSSWTAVLRAFWSIGNSRLQNMTYQLRSCTNLMAVGGNMMYNKGTITSLSGMFQQTAVRFFGDGLFAGMTALTTVSSVFYNWTGIDNNLPDDLFPDSPNLNNCQQIFQNSRITKVFRFWNGKTGITTAFGAYQQCNYIEEVTEDDLSGLYVSQAAGTSSMFANCNRLKRVTIPANITNVEGFCQNGTVMEWAELKATTPPTANNGSFNVSSGLFEYPIYVPDNAVDVYKAASGWGTYIDRIKPVSEKP